MIPFIRISCCKDFNCLENLEIISFNIFKQRIARNYKDLAEYDQIQKRIFSRSKALFVKWAMYGAFYA